jgi:hypothetical protein
MSKSRIGITSAFLIYGAAALVPPVFPQLFPHRHAPAWLRYTTAGVLSLPLLALAGLVATAVVMRLSSRRRPLIAVREVPASNGIQVLGTFLSDGEGGDTR